MRWTLVLLIVVVVAKFDTRAATAPATAPTTTPATAPTSDIETIVGVWGRTNAPNPQEWEFTAKELILRVGPRRIETERHPYKLDEAARPRKLTADGIQAIYELEGDKLRVCWSYGDEKHRPTAMRATPENMLFEFRRK